MIFDICVYTEGRGVMKDGGLVWWLVLAGEFPRGGPCAGLGRHRLSGLLRGLRAPPRGGRGGRLRM